ncbi:hypothetical protein ABKN59_003840 [Abortiporus biennis]
MKLVILRIVLHLPKFYVPLSTHEALRYRSFLISEGTLDNNIDVSEVRLVAKTLPELKVGCMLLHLTLAVHCKATKRKEKTAI